MQIDENLLRRALNVLVGSKTAVDNELRHIALGNGEVDYVRLTQLKVLQQTIDKLTDDIADRLPVLTEINARELARSQDAHRAYLEMIEQIGGSEE